MLILAHSGRVTKKYNFTYFAKSYLLSFFCLYYLVLLSCVWLLTCFSASQPRKQAPTSDYISLTMWDLLVCWYIRFASCVVAAFCLSRFGGLEVWRPATHYKSCTVNSAPSFFLFLAFFSKSNMRPTSKATTTTTQHTSSATRAPHTHYITIYRARGGQSDERGAALLL